ncbi:MAG: DUF4157 domain-containing protein [Moorea sp. SIO4G3]|nr:DUF4157 domain-containing protein [Moorena sp. SIO4G3]
MRSHLQVQQLVAKDRLATQQEKGRSDKETPVQRQKDKRETENKTGLPDHLKERIESMSGHDLSGVRVNYNSPKPAQLNAHAYTQGQTIEVAPGQEQHVPHEAWHVVQQMQGRVKPTMKVKGVRVNNEKDLEKEADILGKRAIQRSSRKRGLHAELIRETSNKPQKKEIIQKNPIPIKINDTIVNLEIGTIYLIGETHDQDEGLATEILKIENDHIKILFEGLSQEEAIQNPEKYPRASYLEEDYPKIMQEMFYAVFVMNDYIKISEKQESNQVEWDGNDFQRVAWGVRQFKKLYTSNNNEEKIFKEKVNKLLSKPQIIQGLPDLLDLMEKSPDVANKNLLEIMIYTLSIGVGILQQIVKKTPKDEFEDSVTNKAKQLKQVVQETEGKFFNQEPTKELTSLREESMIQRIKDEHKNTEALIVIMGKRHIPEVLKEVAKLGTVEVFNSYQEFFTSG